jgi:hypothetical protein
MGDWHSKRDRQLWFKLQEMRSFKYMPKIAFTMVQHTLENKIEQPDQPTIG